MSVESKHLEASETKVSLGPVFAINPRYVKSILLVDCGAESASWIDVKPMLGPPFSSELETLAWCEAKAQELMQANPDIELIRYPARGVA
jgi:hypothetical protein